MSEQMDKLVEEIKDRFCKFLCGGYNYGENRCDCYPRETWGTAQAQCSCLNGTVDFAITRIGKAILSGECPELDKLLGVVGRGKADASSTVTPIKGTCYLGGHIETDDEEFMSGSDTDLVDIPIIALRKEEKKGASDKGS